MHCQLDGSLLDQVVFYFPVAQIVNVPNMEGGNFGFTAKLKKTSTPGTASVQRERNSGKNSQSSNFQHKKRSEFKYWLTAFPATSKKLIQGTVT